MQASGSQPDAILGVIDKHLPQCWRSTFQRKTRTGIPAYLLKQHPQKPVKLRHAPRSRKVLESGGAGWQVLPSSSAYARHTPHEDWGRNTPERDKPFLPFTWSRCLEPTFSSASARDPDILPPLSSWRLPAKIAAGGGDGWRWEGWGGVRGGGGQGGAGGFRSQPVGGGESTGRYISLLKRQGCQPHPKLKFLRE